MVSFVSHNNFYKTKSKMVPPGFQLGNSFVYNLYPFGAVLSDMF